MSNGQVKKIYLQDEKEAINLFGRYDENLKLIEERFAAKIVARGNEITISGEQEEVEKVAKLFEELQAIGSEDRFLTHQEVKQAIEMIKKEKVVDLHKVFTDSIVLKKKHVRPRTPGQKRYVDAMRKNDLVIAIGPGGTGKTYLAIAMAVYALENKEVSRIILVRPAVEAGESLGFLPGDLREKVDPYLRPLYDALYDMMDIERFQKLMERGIIEVAPLAYMRGRTLNDSFIVLDEAQNTTIEQMKMFLTRLGFNSKVVITGDITQVDLPAIKPSGLIHVQSILKGIKGIEFAYFDGNDVVRHELVKEIIRAYEKSEQEERESSKEKGL